MATRRTSEERTKIFKEWSGQERPWLDYLDMKVADMLVKTEGGRIYLKDDLNDEENKLYYKWDRRNHDPSYYWMINVTVNTNNGRSRNGIPD